MGNRYVNPIKLKLRYGWGEGLLNNIITVSHLHNLIHAALSSPSKSKQITELSYMCAQLKFRVSKINSHFLPLRCFIREHPLMMCGNTHID